MSDGMHVDEFCSQSGPPPVSLMIVRKSREHHQIGSRRFQPNGRAAPRHTPPASGTRAAPAQPQGIHRPALRAFQRVHARLAGQHKGNPAACGISPAVCCASSSACRFVPPPETSTAMFSTGSRPPRLSTTAADQVSRRNRMAFRSARTAVRSPPVGTAPGTCRSPC